MLIKGGSNKQGREGLGDLQNSNKKLVWFTFLNLGGVPPLPGFILKIRFLRVISASFYSQLAFLAGSVLLMYMYLRVSFLRLVGTSKGDGEGYLGGRRFRYLILQV